MADLRDDGYVFGSGEHFHLWVRGGYDRWRESGWAGADERHSIQDVGRAVGH